MGSCWASYGLCSGVERGSYSCFLSFFPWCYGVFRFSSSLPNLSPMPKSRARGPKRRVNATVTMVFGRVWGGLGCVSNWCSVVV